DAKQMIRAGGRQIARPLRDGALEIALSLKRFDPAFKPAPRFSICAQDLEDDLANLLRLVWRERHKGGHLRFRVLCPGGVTTDGRHHRPARLPEGRFQLLNQLDLSEAFRLLHRQRTTVNERSKHPRPPIAAT